MDVQVRVHEDFDLGGGFALTQGIHDVPREELPNYETAILDGRLFFPLEIKDLDALNQQLNEQIYNLYRSDLDVVASVPPFDISSPVAGEVLQYDGANWVNAEIDFAPSGSNYEIQYNDSGAFGASSNFKFNGSNVISLVPITSPGVGANSERFGMGSTAGGGGGAAFGFGSKATSDNSTALGALAEVAATYGNGVAVGYNASANNTYGNGVAIGYNATLGSVAGGTESPIAVGAGSSATGNKANAFGAGANAPGSSAFAMGYNTLASGVQAIAFGYAAQSTGSESSIAIGGGANVSGNTAIGIGAGVISSANRSIAIGEGANAGHVQAIAFGKGATTTNDNQIVFGSASAPITAIRQVYDASNYWSCLLSSVGVVTFDAVGSGAKFVFNDPIEGTNLELSGVLEVQTAPVTSYIKSESVELGITAYSFLHMLKTGHNQWHVQPNTFEIDTQYLFKIGDTQGYGVGAHIAMNSDSGGTTVDGFINLVCPTGKIQIGDVAVAGTGTNFQVDLNNNCFIFSSSTMATAFRGWTDSAAPPSTTELPNDKDFCVHYDSTGDDLYFAVNQGGVIKKVALT